MDFGLLFRKRTEAAKKFDTILENKDLLEGEQPWDIRKLRVTVCAILMSTCVVLSYLVGLVISKSISMPIEVCRTVYQVMGPPTTPQPSFFRSLVLASLFNPKRRSVLWTGWTIECLYTAFNILIENVVYESLLKLKSTVPFMVYSDSKSDNSDGGWMSGLISKLISVLCTYPLEVFRTRLILNQFHVSSATSPRLTLRSCANETYVNWRLLKFGCGLLPSIFKVIVYMFVKESITKLLKNSFQQAQPTNNYTHFKWTDIGSSNGSNSTDSDDEHHSDNQTRFTKALMLDYVSGAIAEVFTLPLTVIIKKQQAFNNFVQFFDCMATIWKRKQLKGFFHGFQYQLAEILMIWFGAMFCFTLSRMSVSSFKHFLTLDKQPQQQQQPDNQTHKEMDGRSKHQQPAKNVPHRK